MLFDVCSLLSLVSGGGVSKLEKALAKQLKVVILRAPTKKWARNHEVDVSKDAIMAFHYCPQCEAYRFDRHLDPVSERERYVCGGCCTENLTTLLAGRSFFYADECWRVARELAKKKGKKATRWDFLKLHFGGLGEHLPHDREGRTTGELEMLAQLTTLTVMIMSSVSHK